MQMFICYWPNPTNLSTPDLLLIKYILTETYAWIFFSKESTTLQYLTLLRYSIFLAILIK